ncbi:MAG TPA: hypothetical protein VKG20_21520 [Methylomirabilota bacterium]|nr:hypothetical protein [Methylomirabilota bacterium]
MAVKYAGKAGLVYMSTSGAGAPVLVGGMRAFTIDNSTEDIDVTEFGATNRTSVIGFPSSRGTIEGFWATDDTTLRQAASSSDGTNIALYPSRDAMARYFGGPAWVDQSLRTAVDAAVTTSGNWRSRGNMINQL